jgi:hypothetical protein
MYLTTEENSSHEKMFYNYSKKMRIRRVKRIHIIDDPDNQRPDKWSSAVFYNSIYPKM